MNYARQTRDALTIRPHHLTALTTWRSLGRKSAADGIPISEIYYNYVEQDIRTAVTPMKVMESEDFLSYVQDVYGKTHLSAQMHVDAATNIIDDLTYGPSDTTVDIRLQKDRICLETCIVGDHCNDFTASETEYIDKFVETAGITDTDYTLEQSGRAVSTDLRGLRRVLDYVLRGDDIDGLEQYLQLPDADPSFHPQGPRHTTGLPDWSEYEI